MTNDLMDAYHSGEVMKFLRMIFVHGHYYSLGMCYLYRIIFHNDKYLQFLIFKEMLILMLLGGKKVGFFFSFRDKLVFQPQVKYFYWICSI